MPRCPHLEHVYPVGCPGVGFRISPVCPHELQSNSIFSSNVFNSELFIRHSTSIVYAAVFVSTSGASETLIDVSRNLSRHNISVEVNNRKTLCPIYRRGSRYGHTSHGIINLKTVPMTVPGHVVVC